MEYENLLEGLKAHKEVIITYKGQRILDSKLAKILEDIDEKGSILSAAKSQGVSYSWVWNKINEVEEQLGKKIVYVKRGGRRGGGASLTDVGRLLLDFYNRSLDKSYRKIPKAKTRADKMIVGGGYDPVIEALLKQYVNEIEFQWMGSLTALTGLLAGTIDVAGIHIYDPETGTFNIPYVRRLWLSDSIIVMRGFEREMGLIFRPELDISFPSEIIERGLRYVNLIKGHGARILADCLLRMSARMLGYDDPNLEKLVRGYDLEVRTSFGVAKKIARGEADVGFGIRKVAMEFGLGFKRLLWENYDLAIRRESLGKPMTSKIIETLMSEKAKGIIRKSEGYRLSPDFGAVLLR